MTANDYLEYRARINFQLNIAKRWLERGKKSPDPFAKFFFFFTGFNALYFLWSIIDKANLAADQKSGETKQIAELIHKFSELEAQSAIDQMRSDVAYFCDRSPIQRMDERKVSGSEAGNLQVGNPREGKKWQGILCGEGNAILRLEALAEILYLVRCNLVHGSKAESGDDAEIIRHSIEPLRLMVAKSIEVTERRCAPNS